MKENFLLLGRIGGRGHVVVEPAHQSGGNLGAKAIEQWIEGTHAIKESKVVQEPKDESKYKTSIEVPEHFGVGIPKELVHLKRVLRLNRARRVCVVGHQLHTIDVCGKRRDVLGCHSVDVNAPHGDENGKRNEHNAHKRGKHKAPHRSFCRARICILANREIQCAFIIFCIVKIACRLNEVQVCAHDRLPSASFDTLITLQFQLHTSKRNTFKLLYKIVFRAILLPHQCHE